MRRGTHAPARRVIHFRGVGVLASWGARSPTRRCGRPVSRRCAQCRAIRSVVRSLASDAFERPPSAAAAVHVLDRVGGERLEALGADLVVMILRAHSCVAIEDGWMFRPGRPFSNHWSSRSVDRGVAGDDRLAGVGVGAHVGELLARLGLRLAPSPFAVSRRRRHGRPSARSWRRRTVLRRLGVADSRAPRKMFNRSRPRCRGDDGRPRKMSHVGPFWGPYAGGFRRTLANGRTYISPAQESTHGRGEQPANV